MEDTERNNGKDKPYFMDQDLLDLTDLKNEKGEETALVEETNEEMWIHQRPKIFLKYF